MSDTIVALATPTGRSGIGVIRLSGNDSLLITREMVRDPKFSPEPRSAYLKQLYASATGDVIDESIITYFKSPNSFTGEDVVEFSCHGSPVLLRQVIDICLESGARMADAGEFTLRALSNGRMNLAEAEAIRDLIDSQTTASARQAIRQLRGEFSKQLQPLKDDLLDIIVLLKSALEFVEDDIPEAQKDDVRLRITKIKGDIATIASTFTAGRLLREGLKVAIVGRPNVGKSSLFNALLGTERAIVTEIAGTTRDQLHERFTVDGIPISLIDTAGLRETTDTVESIGVEGSRATMADADLIVMMLDASEEVISEDLEILKNIADIDHIVAVNKIDKIDRRDVGNTVTRLRNALHDQRSRIVALSAKTGEGLGEFQRTIIEPFSPQDISVSGFLVTDARHHDLLVRATDEAAQSLEQLDSGMSEEIVLIGLHNALRYLGQITGETSTEDMLTRIFSTFCIGK